jgi:hypothetical protein
MNATESCEGFADEAMTRSMPMPNRSGKLLICGRPLDVIDDEYIGEGLYSVEL